MKTPILKPDEINFFYRGGKLENDSTLDGIKFESGGTIFISKKSDDEDLFYVEKSAINISEDQINFLQSMFPHISKGVINSALLKSNGNADDAALILTDETQVNELSMQFARKEENETQNNSIIKTSQIIVNNIDYFKELINLLKYNEFSKLSFNILSCIPISEEEGYEIYCKLINFEEFENPWIIHYYLLISISMISISIKRKDLLKEIIEKVSFHGLLLKIFNFFNSIKINDKILMENLIFDFMFIVGSIIKCVMLNQESLKNYFEFFSQFRKNIGNSTIKKINIISVQNIDIKELPEKEEEITLINLTIKNEDIELLLKLIIYLIQKSELEISSFKQIAETILIILNYNEQAFNFLIEQKKMEIILFEFYKRKWNFECNKIIEYFFIQLSSILENKITNEQFIKLSSNIFDQILELEKSIENIEEKNINTLSISSLINLFCIIKASHKEELISFFQSLVKTCKAYLQLNKDLRQEENICGLLQQARKLFEYLKYECEEYTELIEFIVDTIFSKTIFLNCQFKPLLWEGLEFVSIYANKNEKSHSKVLNELISFHSKVQEKSFIEDTNGKSIIGYCGLKNLGNTCYINSLLQQLFMIPELRFGLLLNDKIYKMDDSENVLFNLRNLFATLALSNCEYCSSSTFCGSLLDLDYKPIDVKIQQDTHEFFNLLTNKMENELKCFNCDSLLRNTMGGVTIQEIKSIEEGYPYASTKEEPFLVLSLDIKNITTLEEALDAFIKEDFLVDDNRVYCEEYACKIKASKRCIIKESANTLIFHLKRFEFNIINMQRSKISDYFSFPITINMKKWEWSESDIKDDDIYNLVGILVHTGNAEGGHYYSYIKERNPNHPYFGKWFEFNDSKILNFDSKRIKESCFGLNISTSNEGDIEVFTPCAYILFYEKSSLCSLRENLKPSLPSFLQNSVETEILISSMSRIYHDQGYYSFLKKFLEYFPFQTTKDINPLISDNMYIKKERQKTRKLLNKDEINIQEEIWDEGKCIIPPKSTGFEDLIQLKIGFIYGFDYYEQNRSKEILASWMECLIPWFSESFLSCAWTLKYLESKFKLVTDILTSTTEKVAGFSQLIFICLKNIFQAESKYINEFESILIPQSNNAVAFQKQISRSIVVRFLERFVQYIKDIKYTISLGLSEIFVLLIKTSQYDKFFIQFYLNNNIINKLIELSQITEDNTLCSIIHTIQLLVTLTKTSTMCPITYQGKQPYESACELPKSIFSMMLGEQFSLTYNLMQTANENLIKDLITIFMHLNNEDIICKILKYTFRQQGENMVGIQNSMKIFSILLLDCKYIPNFFYPLIEEKEKSNLFEMLKALSDMKPLIVLEYIKLITEKLENIEISNQIKLNVEKTMWISLFLEKIKNNDKLNVQELQEQEKIEIDKLICKWINLKDKAIF